MTAHSLRMEDAPFLDRLIDAYPFNPYRNYRLLSRRRQAAVLRAEIDRAMESEGDCLGTVTGTGEGIVTAICRSLPWDTAFFGIGMARLDYLLRGSGGNRWNQRTLRFKNVVIRQNEIGPCGRVIEERTEADDRLGAF